ncbi:YchF family ATPase [Candidatus Microgenomates bacterium]|nr:YchF family ATPase [Candidatus Microgenomates bacterium]
MLKVGIIGLPNVGKSTLFNALLKKQAALVANYPFATIEPNIGIVPVPDERLDKLAQLVKLAEGMIELPPIVPATVKFVDIAGLVKGASQGEGLGNQFLSHIREVDAIIHVIRDFDDPNVVRAGGSTNPHDDKELVETELALADIDKQDKLSTKPTLYVYNVSEQNYRQKYSDRNKNVQANELVISAKLEEELVDFSQEERLEYLKSVGILETGLEKLIKAAYKLLGLISFLTAGEKEVRAWTIRLGSTSLMASGVIHTDFEKKFIKAEVVRFSDFVEVGGWKGAREKGKARLEGRDYIIKDGDVIEFKVGA